jgi:hypothetical protein
MPTPSNLTFKPEISPTGYAIARSAFFKWLNYQGKHILLILEFLILCILGVNFYFAYQANQIEKTLSDKYTFYMQNDNQKIIQEFQKVQKDISMISLKIQQQDLAEKKIQNAVDLIPNRIELVSLAYDSGAIALRALAPDTPTFGIFITNLISDNKIKSVLLRKSAFDKSSKVFDFELTLVY